MKRLAIQTSALYDAQGLRAQAEEDRWDSALDFEVIDLRSAGLANPLFWLSMALSFAVAYGFAFPSLAPAILAAFLIGVHRGRGGARGL